MLRPMEPGDYRSILAAVDLDAEDADSGPLAVAAAFARRSGGRLTLCTILPSFRAAAEAEWSALGLREMIDVARARLGGLATRIAHLECEREVGTGSIADGILDIAQRVGADLIVIGARHPGLGARLLGANATRVVAHAHCSVLVARQS